MKTEYRYSYERFKKLMDDKKYSEATEDMPQHVLSSFISLYREDKINYHLDQVKKLI